MKKIIILLKIFGSLAIISATFIFASKVYKIDNSLSDINEEIFSHKNNTLLTMQLLSTINEKFIQRRLDLFERNNLIVNNLNSPILSELEDRVFESTKKIIKKWDASLKDVTESEQDWENLNRELDQIILKKDVNFDDKLKQLEEIRHEKSELFKERNEEYQEKLKGFRIKEKELKDKKVFWNCLFIWLQVLGLVILGISEILLIKLE